MKKYSNRIANHLHIPLQGGSDNTLLRMKRKYNINEYRKLILKIRNMFPNIAITTDCLAGFVGETDKDFNDSLEFIKEMKFSSMHIFPYSRRSGTEADKMQDHLDNSIIKKRARIMIDIASNLKKEYEEKFLNIEFEVLFEQKKKEYWIGHTSNYLEVYLESNEELTNKVIKCKITKMKNNKLFAEEVK
jgi:threonylcarbamoyladenosine tRNA methylthiotransferase MtaB